MSFQVTNHKIDEVLKDIETLIIWAEQDIEDSKKKISLKYHTHRLKDLTKAYSLIKVSRK